MPDNRFYIDQTLQVGAPICITEKEAHHIATVMRKKVHEQVEIVNGKNQLAYATLLSVQSKKVELLIDEVIEGTLKEKSFILCQAMCDFSRLDLILEKSTELGVLEIWLFGAERSQKKELSAHQMERMKAILISAMKQCGRLNLPQLHFYSSLESLPAMEGALFFGDLHPEAPSFLSCLKGLEKVFFFIGPPAGFSDKEIESLRKVGAKGVSLSNHILRTETAAIAAVTLGMGIDF